MAEDSEREIESAFTKRNSHCPKSNDGKHDWRVFGDAWTCKHCGKITKEQMLVEG